MNAEEFLSQLNDPQREAVETVDGPLLIIAGAGSGKTRVITYRIAYMLQYCQVPPWNIFAVTFTNKAAGEMRGRVIDLIGYDPGPSLQVSTFHSACARLLRREHYKTNLSPNFTICDESDQKAIIKEAMSQLGIEKDELNPAMVLNVISQSKMRMLTHEDYEKDADTEQEEQTAAIFKLYEQRLRENDAVDFDDLLGKVVTLFDESPETLAEYQKRFQYVLVDEYQDTNFVQYRLVEAMAREHRNLCVVGDEDQSIYSWRGAEISNLLDFQEHFPEARTIRLEQNYRSTQAILSLANICISNNKERLGKNLWTAREGGDKPALMVCESQNDEARRVVDAMLRHNAQGMAFRDMAVFYRANALSRPIEDQLRKLNVPYRVVGGLRFYDRMEIKDLIAYLQLVENPNNSIAFARVVNKPRRGIGDKSVVTLQRLADQYRLSCYAAIERGAKEDLLPRGAGKKFLAFREMVEGWRRTRKKGERVSDLLEQILKDTEYEEKLGNPKDFEVAARIENIAEFKTVIREFEEENRSAELGDFLEMITLRSSVDEMGDEDAVSLMTVHCAKGLEYKVVFVIALEEPIFPSGLAVEEKESVEEERRLFYVAVTRAEERLYLSRAESRFRFGQVMTNDASRFLTEIPDGLIEEAEDDGGGRLSSYATGHERGFGRPRRRGSSYRRGQVKRGSAFDRPAASAGAAAAGGKFKADQRVRHAIFGDGTVREVVKMSGGKSMLIVDFDDDETRAMPEQRAGLKAI